VSEKKRSDGLKIAFAIPIKLFTTFEGKNEKLDPILETISHEKFMANNQPQRHDKLILLWQGLSMANE
jgi:hypothetical protein